MGPVTSPQMVDAFSHEAFLYSDLAEFLDETCGFVREGLERDEAVLVATGGDRLAGLRSFFGTEPEVQLVEMAEVGANPAYPARRHHDGHGALATVGHRPTPDLDRDPRGLGGVAQPGLDRRRRVVRGQAPRERVGGDDHGRLGRCGHTVTPALSRLLAKVLSWAETLAQPPARSRAVQPAMSHADQGAGGVPWAQ